MFLLTIVICLLLRINYTSIHALKINVDGYWITNDKSNYLHCSVINNYYRCLTFYKKR